MDPLSQAVTGALLAQAFTKRKEDFKLSAVAGAVGGMLADADVLIRSANDPLLTVEYHRHFTHSLFFIPFGGLIAAVLLFYFFRKHHRFSMVLLYATLGYATAGLLDACTTYGTHLLWPLNDDRIAWSVIAIVDPSYTLPLLLAVTLAAFRKTLLWNRLACIWALFYLSLGFIQHGRAVDAGIELAQSRGDTVGRMVAHPTMGNLLLWRIIYETKDELQFDAIRLSIGESEHQIYHGHRLKRLLPEQYPKGIQPESQAARDIDRFRRFSDGWIAQPEPSTAYKIGDQRYASLPHRNDPLWAIFVDPQKPDAHVDFRHTRSFQKGDFKQFWQMIQGKPQPAP